MTSPRRYTPIFAACILASGCAAPQIISATQPSLTATRHTQAELNFEDGSTFETKQNAPIASFGPDVALPKGPALNLEFNRKGDDPGKLNVVYYADNVPFTLTVKQGSTFVVLDSDASDGTAVVQVPGSAYDYYFATKGKPSGDLGIQDPVYFMKGAQSSTTAKRDWVHVGLRTTNLPASYRRGATRFLFTPSNLVGGFSGRLIASSTTPSLPPIPPSIMRLSAPDFVQPGGSASVAVVANDQNGDALASHWQISAGSIAGDATSATLTAPRTAGTYEIGLSLEDSYFITSTSRPLTITVPNLPPVPSISGLTTQVNPGDTLSLLASATDENWDAITWRFETSGGSFSLGNGSTQTGPEGTTLSTAWTAPSQPGSYTITAIANDGHGGEQTYTQTITVVDPLLLTGGNSDKDHTNNGQGNDKIHDNNGHGNDPGHYDPSNPGKKYN